GATAETDVDGDGILNSSDTDIDGDGISNSLDDSPYGPLDANSLDTDGDGIVNALDNDLDNDGIINSRDFDVDGDGTPNVALYSTGPGIPHWDRLDIDYDNDGSRDTGADFITDIDGDGINDIQDDDRDGDGIKNDDWYTENGTVFHAGDTDDD